MMKIETRALLRSMDAPGWALVPGAGGEPDEAQEAARIGAHVRSLVAASKLIHQAARERCSLAPGRQVVEALCEAMLTELSALADPDAVPAGAHDGQALPDDERERRIGRLLVAGRALVDDCDAGMFDDEARHARLAEHTRLLGSRYVELLARIAVPEAGPLA